MGYVQVYTGNGKGKTTAALGISMRMVCAGKRVYFGQFIKGMDYSELKLGSMLNGFTIKQYGRDCFIFNKPTDEDIKVAREGLTELSDIMSSGNYDMVVLDEANIAVHYNLISCEELIDAIKGRASNTEVIITGRYAKDELKEYADLVSEVLEVKHYYKDGVQARVGIEK